MATPPADTSLAQPPTSLTQDALHRLEEMITREMPITQYLNFSLAHDADGTIKTSVPLAPNNVNHVGSAFGGSISMAATLTGWAMMHALVEEMKQKAEVLIQESQIDYLEPIRENFAVICEPPDADALASFHAMLERWGRARLKLRCTIEAAGEQAVTFMGQYVALATGTEPEEDAPPAADEA